MDTLAPGAIFEGTKLIHSLNIRTVLFSNSEKLRAGSRVTLCPGLRGSQEVGPSIIKLAASQESETSLSPSLEGRRTLSSHQQKVQSWLLLPFPFLPWGSVPLFSKLSTNALRCNQPSNRSSRHSFGTREQAVFLSQAGCQARGPVKAGIVKS